MSEQRPSLFGLHHSNRDFTQKEAWKKNCFNSSFPVSLCSYMYNQGYENIYLKLDANLTVFRSKINTEDFYGINPNSENLFYAFETQFTPYQQFIIGNLPRIDLVIQSKDYGHCLQAIEIKLTALPDHTTCDLSEDLYGCEIVVRPDSIVYLACSIVDIFKHKIETIRNLIGENFDSLTDWTEPSKVISYVPEMINIIDSMFLSILDHQKPFLMQPIWKTEGKSSRLAQNCLDIFVWSNLSFTRLFMDLVKSELKVNQNLKEINRFSRSLIWLFKMIFDFSKNEKFNHKKIIDELSYNTKNDKAFAVSGRVTHNYLNSETLRQPRIKKTEIKNIILGGGQNLLSPERRFDAIIYNSSELLFDQDNNH